MKRSAESIPLGARQSHCRLWGAGSLALLLALGCGDSDSSSGDEGDGGADAAGGSESVGSGGASAGQTGSGVGGDWSGTAGSDGVGGAGVAGAGNAAGAESTGGTDTGSGGSGVGGGSAGSPGVGGSAGSPGAGGAAAGSPGVGGSAGGPGAGGAAAGSPGVGGSAGAGTGGSAPVDGECNDGIDNDGDGLVDWQFDVGCYAADDPTEASLPRAEENGWTTFDLSADSLVIYVSSSDGDDANDGLTPETAVATPARGAELVRDGYPDFLLFRRGDTWRAQDIGPDRVVRRFKSGQDAEHPIVIYSYGDSTERPRFEIDKHFIDHDGNERNYVAIVGLAFISYPKVPGDPAFNGADGGGLRLIGTGHDILVEDNYVEYGEFTSQNETDVTFRRNVIYKSYHVDTCAYETDGSLNPNGDSTYRPSGIFCGGVDGLVIEENVWDHNGWNPDVTEACATIYNHDLYLSGNSRLRVRDNLILRASSIGIKMSSGGPGESTDIVIENNLFAEGEIGLSMGGNADTEYRFVDAQVLDNVFTDIGRAQPTTRTLTWYIDLIDNDGTLVSGNLLVNQPPLNNPYGIQLSGGTNRDITIENNFLYGLLRRHVVVDAVSAWSNITVQNNTFVSETTDECLMSHAGGFGAFTYAGNAYASGADSGTWFCVDGTRRSLAEWSTDSGETGATTAAVTPPDPGRNLDSYAADLGLGSTLADFADAARQQSRHNWRPELTAATANNYIREGFGVPLR